MAYTSEDAAKKYFDEYKKKYPGTKKKWQDFIEKAEKDEAKKEEPKSESPSKSPSYPKSLNELGSLLVKNYKPDPNSPFKKKALVKDVAKELSNTISDTFRTLQGIHGGEEGAAALDRLDKRLSVVSPSLGAFTKDIYETVYDRGLNKEAEAVATEAVTSVIMGQAMSDLKKKLPGADAMSDVEFKSKFRKTMATKAYKKTVGKMRSKAIGKVSQADTKAKVLQAKSTKIITRIYSGAFGAAADFFAVGEGKKAADGAPNEKAMSLILDDMSTFDEHDLKVLSILNKKGFKNVSYQDILKANIDIGKESFRNKKAAEDNSESAKKQFEAYKKEYPGTEKTWQDFLVKIEEKKKKEESSQEKPKNKKVETQVSPKEKKILKDLEDNIAEPRSKVISTLSSAATSTEGLMKGATDVSLAFGSLMPYSKDNPEEIKKGIKQIGKISKKAEDLLSKTNDYLLGGGFKSEVEKKENQILDKALNKVTVNLEAKKMQVLFAMKGVKALADKAKKSLPKSFIEKNKNVFNSIDDSIESIATTDVKTKAREIAKPIARSLVKGVVSAMIPPPIMIGLKGIKVGMGIGGLALRAQSRLFKVPFELKDSILGKTNKEGRLLTAAEEKAENKKIIDAMMKENMSFDETDALIIKEAFKLGDELTEENIRIAATKLFMSEL